ncbi:MAG: DUF1016 N-terminal domain-containing protein [Kiritimatiellae bacterium]|jgi:hypothetical protein|nr:DUF1016 N-terminal domain-containing protein [Kiritimatiellia bacterium]
MEDSKNIDFSSVSSSLFERVVNILEEARANVVRSVNSNMVVAYWLIGREIVEEIQGGDKRAEYGKQVLKKLSEQLNDHYGSGFSVPNLQNFRKFYQIYSDRLSIQYPVGTKFISVDNDESVKQYPVGTKSESSKIIPLLGSELTTGFSPQLSWSHYRALMRVKDDKAREFYAQRKMKPWPSIPS